MDAQRAALDVSARNIAAAQAAGPRGSYDREVPLFHLAQSEDGTQLTFSGTAVERGSGADALTEMVAVLNASRAYEANASVFETGKQLAMRTIDMGKL